MSGELANYAGGPEHRFVQEIHLLCNFKSCIKFSYPGHTADKMLLVQHLVGGELGNYL